MAWKATSPENFVQMASMRKASCVTTLSEGARCRSTSSADAGLRSAPARVSADVGI